MEKANAMAGGKRKVKRKVNKSLRDWVAFVKKVQREEKLSYPEAIRRAKQRKDKGEKWKMKGGDGEESVPVMDSPAIPMDEPAMDGPVSESPVMEDMPPQAAGRRQTRRRSRGRSRSRSKGRTRSRGRSRGRA